MDVPTRRRIVRAAVSVVVLVCIGSSCSGSDDDASDAPGVGPTDAVGTTAPATEPTSPSTALEDTSVVRALSELRWNYSEIDGSGPLPAGDPWIQLERDDLLGGYDGCNWFGYPITIDDRGAVTDVGGLASTERLCGGVEGTPLVLRVGDTVVPQTPVVFHVMRDGEAIVQLTRRSG